jgi:hypothetical protein
LHQLNKYIHHITVVYLALIILVRMMAMPISLADYTLNKKFIAANLCENKLKPELHCSGKCYLKKQLAKTNDNQPASGQKASSMQVQPDFCQPLEKLSLGSAALPVNQNGGFQTPRLPGRHTGSIFHPPLA